MPFFHDMFKAPYTSLQELNLDWLLTKVKNILRFVPDDGYVGQILRRTSSGAEWSDEQGGGGAVSSVNGQTGAVILTASDVGALPDSYTAPVDSVNGQTGTVVLDASNVGALPDTYTAPVDSVNGQTGTVVLDASDVGALPDTYTAPVDSVNGQTGTVVLGASDVGALPDTYTAPVTSVNGQTGAVVIPTGGISGWGTDATFTFPFTPTKDGMAVVSISPQTSANSYMFVYKSGNTYMRGMSSGGTGYGMSFPVKESIQYTQQSGNVGNYTATFIPFE